MRQAYLFPLSRLQTWKENAFSVEPGNRGGIVPLVIYGWQASETA